MTETIEAYRPRTVWVVGGTPKRDYRIEINGKELYMNARKQIPAKPATKNTVKDDDFSTDYKPPVIKTVFDSITIVDDAPIYKHAEPYKYHEIFDKLKVGQGLRIASKDISKVCGAMRKWICLRNRTSDVHVKSCLTYGDDAGFGRIWLMAGKSLFPSRKKQ